MRTSRTIRNCLPVFRVVCPLQWEALAPTDDPCVRHCGQCDRRVYYCTTDAETVAHAEAGHCIAREVPDASEVPAVYIGEPNGRPSRSPPWTPQQSEAARLRVRERGIDDAIRNAPISTRCCPSCQYPAPDWRVSCRVCGFEFGRVVAGGSADAEPGAAADPPKASGV